MPLGLDKETKEFIEDYIDSFIHWDLIAFFAKKSGTRNDTASIARRLGRKQEDLDPILENLTKKGILASEEKTEKLIYLYSPSPKQRKCIDDFVQALDSRINRMMILTEFLQKKGGQIA